MNTKNPFYLQMDTDIDAQELREKLAPWAPWSIKIEFSNGVSTTEFEKRVPFAENPLQKLDIANKGINLEQFRGGRLLDIGCNSGYNSIHCARTYGMQVKGIDYNPRHIEVSSFLTELGGLSDQCNFELASAEEYSEADAFDVVLHFGTLYHLKNPLSSIDRAIESLKPGGYLGLETQVFDHPDNEDICSFMHMHNNDSTNFWALSSAVLSKCLMLAGFEQPQEMLKVSPKMLAEHMHRIVVVARKPD